MKSQAKPSAHSWLAHPTPAATEPTDQTELLARHLYESSSRHIRRGTKQKQAVSTHSIFASHRYSDIADRWRTIAADALIFLQP